MSPNYTLLYYLNMFWVEVLLLAGATVKIFILLNKRQIIAVHWQLHLMRHKTKSKLYVLLYIHGLHAQDRLYQLTLGGVKISI